MRALVLIQNKTGGYITPTPLNTSVNTAELAAINSAVAGQVLPLTFSYTEGVDTVTTTIFVRTDPRVFTVRFYHTDGTLLKTQQVNKGTDATAPANPTRIGYTFTGWDRAFTNVRADIDVGAQFSINVYTVAFVDFDGTSLSSQRINYGSAATAPTSPTRTGYTFTGWNQSFSFITSNLTITALYVPVSYTLSYAPGAPASEVRGLPASVVATIGDSATIGLAPTRMGYTFSGWSSSLGATLQPGDSFTFGAEDVVLTALWQQDSTTSANTSNPQGTLTPTEVEPNTGQVPLDFEDALATQNIPSMGVPLFGPSTHATWSLFDLIVSLVAILLAAVVGIRALLRATNKKREEDIRYSEQDQAKRRTRIGLLLAVGICAVAELVIFLITQDITTPMVLFDWWSIIMSLILVVEVLACILSFRRTGERPTQAAFPRQA
jgi:uncharacterized repeat protein (TIGR02543 family)